MTQTMITQGTASQRASALAHLARRSAWVTVTNQATGRRFIVVPSSDRQRAYYVNPAGDACTCPGFQFSRGAGLCSHSLAVSMANAEEDAARSPKKASYSELFPDEDRYGNVSAF